MELFKIKKPDSIDPASLYSIFKLGLCRYKQIAHINV
jgi:hypothetical protein